jgi:Anti-sigma-K factor rskA, C-terminal/Sigma-70, region 4
MARIDDLPPDERAVLQLVLQQGRSYADLAGLLSIPEAEVRRRAVSAADRLGPGTVRIPPDRRAQVVDYLLGQTSEREAEDTREFLAGSAGGRAWSRGVAGELRALKPEGLPEIPEGEAATEPAAAAAAPAAATPGAGTSRTPSSRIGGLIVIAGVVALVVVLAVALIGGGDDDKDSAASTGSTQTTPAQPKVEGQLALKGEGKARGLASIVSQGPTRAMALVGEKMPPNGSKDTYVVWLTGPNGKVQRLGFPQQPVGKDGKFSALAVLPDQLTGLDTVVISLEKTQDPKKPSRTILEGKLSELQAVPQQQQGTGTSTTTTPSG